MKTKCEIFPDRHLVPGRYFIYNLCIIKGGILFAIFVHRYSFVVYYNWGNDKLN